MNEEIAPDMPLAEVAEETSVGTETDNSAVEAASREYLGRWISLVSTTNWEKGRIVAEWRAALIEAGAPASAYSDEAWSRRVGSVTPQHTGRLRRVYQRFESSRAEYRGLHWSHFQAALDWDDAEMWLEGAVQNRWSIAQMQGERSRTLGALVQESVEAVAVDEDAPATSADLSAADSATTIDSAETASAGPDEAYYDDAPLDGAESFADDDEAGLPALGAGLPTPPFRPFENLPNLPPDLREAFDSFKLAVIHHRISNWQEISREDLLITLDALRQLVLAEA